MKVKDLTKTALLAAAICILAPWTLPMGVLPMTLGSLAVSFAGGIGGAKRGTAAVAIYILLGTVGLPVFSGFIGGAQTLFGITGGFIFGYVSLCLSVGLICDKKPTFLGCLLGNAIGYTIMYLIGAGWYCFVANVSFVSALAVCVLPFVLSDFFKILVSCAIIPRMKRALDKRIN